MKQIVSDIKEGKFKSAYLIFGEEKYLVRNIKERLIKATCKDGDTMNFTKYAGKDIDVSDVIGNCDTLPFFSDYRVILIEDSGFFKSANEMIQDYCEALGSYGLKGAIEKTKSKNARKNIKKIFETIANTPEDGKILFHCSHGKDRTGILSMLILSLAGVSKEDIVKNFLECYNKDGKSKVQPFTKEAVEKFIDFLTERYGDVEKFLKDKCGVSDETIKKVKKRIISS